MTQPRAKSTGSLLSLVSYLKSSIHKGSILQATPTTIPWRINAVYNSGMERIVVMDNSETLKVVSPDQTKKSPYKRTDAPTG